MNIIYVRNNKRFLIRNINHVHNLNFITKWIRWGKKMNMKQAPNFSCKWSNTNVNNNYTIIIATILFINKIKLKLKYFAWHMIM